MTVDHQTLVQFTTTIASAYAGHNTLLLEDVPGLISETYAALAGLGAPPAPVEPARIPAVSIRASVKHDHIVCLDCGAKLKMLKRHISTHHGLTPEQYAQRWNLPVDYSLVSPEYSDKRRDLAVANGLGHSLAAGRGRKGRGA